MGSRGTASSTSKTHHTAPSHRATKTNAYQYGSRTEGCVSAKTTERSDAATATTSTDATTADASTAATARGAGHSSPAARHGFPGTSRSATWPATACTVSTGNGVPGRDGPAACVPGQWTWCPVVKWGHEWSVSCPLTHPWLTSSFNGIPFTRPCLTQQDAQSWSTWPQKCPGNPQE